MWALRVAIWSSFSNIRHTLPGALLPLSGQTRVRLKWQFQVVQSGGTRWCPSCDSASLFCSLKNCHTVSGITVSCNTCSWYCRNSYSTWLSSAADEYLRTVGNLREFSFTVNSFKSILYVIIMHFVRKYDNLEMLVEALSAELTNFAFLSTGSHSKTYVIAVV